MLDDTASRDFFLAASVLRQPYTHRCNTRHTCNRERASADDGRLWNPCIIGSPCCIALVSNRRLRERELGCLARSDRIFERLNSLTHFLRARWLFRLVEVATKSFERFIFPLQTIGGHADIVLELSATTQTIRVPEVNQRPFVVRIRERVAAALEVLSPGRVVRRVLRSNRRCDRRLTLEAGQLVENAA